MDLQIDKRHACPLDQGEGILLVDIEAEMMPCTDIHGNPLYYCLTGQHIFSVDTYGKFKLYQRRDALRKLTSSPV